MHPNRMMFGVVTVAVAIVTLFLLKTPGNRGNTPSQALATCVEAIKNEDMWTFSEYTINGDKFWEEWLKQPQEERDILLSMIPMMMGDVCREDYSITKEEIEGDKATLWVEIVFDDMPPEHLRYYMRKEGDRWKFEDTENLY